jgi:hypothetical protein
LPGIFLAEAIVFMIVLDEALASSLAGAAEKSWRRLNGHHHQLPKILG